MSRYIPTVIAALAAIYIDLKTDEMGIIVMGILAFSAMAAMIFPRHWLAVAVTLGFAPFVGECFAAVFKIQAPFAGVPSAAALFAFIPSVLGAMVGLLLGTMLRDIQRLMHIDQGV